MCGKHVVTFQKDQGKCQRPYNTIAEADAAARHGRDSGCIF